MTAKTYLNINVYDAAKTRIHQVYDEVDKVCVSFSGGKDSTVLLNLVINVARERGKLPVDVMFIDWEAQYQSTISYITEMMARPEINPYWIALPLTTDNGTSVFEPLFTSWDQDKKDKLVRPLPTMNGVISEYNVLPFYKYGMSFEEFVPAFGKWYAGDQKAAILVGIRSSESLNRFRTIKKANRHNYENIKWSTRISENVFNFYPIYDWTVEDIWTFVAKEKINYNQIYDKMFLAGKSIHQMRVNEPYGPEARKTLDEVQQIEPETWSKLVQRLEGVNFGAKYAKTSLLGYLNSNDPPPGHTWKSFAQFLLDSLPPATRDHYKRRIDVFVKWFEDHRGWTDLLDADDPKLEAKKMGGSWRMVARTLLKNDYYCFGLSFQVNKDEFDKHQALKQKYKGDLSMKKVGMINGMTTYIMTSTEDGEQFYGKMGKFFSSKAVRNELDGYPIDDDEHHVWFLVMAGDTVVAFASVITDQMKKGKLKLGDYYVVEGHRGRKVATQLLKMHLEYAKQLHADVIEVVANERSLGLFEKAGFEVTRQRGKFAYMAKEVNVNEPVQQ